jgi:hypothetical protein
MDFPQKHSRFGYKSDHEWCVNQEFRMQIVYGILAVIQRPSVFRSGFGFFRACVPGMRSGHSWSTYKGQTASLICAPRHLTGVDCCLERTTWVYVQV